MQNVLKYKYTRDFLIFLLCWLLYGIVANVWVQFPNFDWLNYQHYNAWAFLNDRISTDFLAANIRSYFNPYLNVFQYLLLHKFNYHPRIFLFLSTIDGGLILFLLYKISNLILDIPQKWKNKFLFLVIAYVALSPIMFEITDFSRNDGYITFLELVTLYILLKNLFKTDTFKRALLVSLSGILLGVAAGFKLSAFVYCVTFFLCILLLHKKIEKPIKTLCLFTCSASLAFLLVDGYWMYVLYKNFQNPLFPHFNNIFKSKFYDSVSVVGYDYFHYKPRNIVEFIFYPFYICYKQTHEVCFGTDDFFIDARYAIAFLSILFLNIAFLLKKIKFDERMFFLINYVLISYYFNILVFGCYRFVIASSVFFGVLLLYSIIKIFELFQKSNYKYIIVIFSVMISFVYFSQTLGDKSFLSEHKFDISPVVNVPNLNIEDKSVLFVNTVTSVVLPTQNASVKCVGYVLPKKYKDETFMKNLMGLYYEEFLVNSQYSEDYIKKILSSSDKIYILFSTDWYKGMFEIYKDSVGFYNVNRKTENCKKIDISLFNTQNIPLGVEICEID